MALAAAMYVRPNWLLFIREQLEPLGFMGVALYLILQTLWSLTTVPSIPLLIVAGLVFGPWLGSTLALVGIVTGSALTFLIGRHFLTRHINRWRKRYPQLDRSIHFAERHDVTVLLVARTGPVFPLNLLNYALGATEVSFRRYLVVSFFASLPAAIIYAGLGEALHRHIAQGQVSVGALLLLGAALILLGLVIWAIRRRYATRLPSSL